MTPFKNRSEWYRYAVAGGVAMSMLACGPTASTTGGAADDSGSSSLDETTAEASSSESSSTGGPSFCDGEPLSESAWCHTPVDFDVSPMEVGRIFAHVVPGEDGGASLLLSGRNGPMLAGLVRPDVFQELILEPSLDGDAELVGFSVEPLMGSSTRLTPVRLYADAEGRHDYLVQGVNHGCVRGTVVVSPERAADFRELNSGTSAPGFGFQDCWRSLFAPLAMTGEPADAFFFFCGEQQTSDGEYCLALNTDPPTGFGIDQEPLLTVQSLPSPGCEGADYGPLDFVVGQFDESGAEQVIVLPRPCDDEVYDALWTVSQAGAKQVAWGATIPLGPLAELNVALMQVLDVNQDGLDDLLLVGEGVVGVVAGGPEGLSEPILLDAFPVALPYLEGEKLLGVEDRYPPKVRVGAGQFDSTPELEIVVRENSGVRLISLDGSRSLSLEELATDFAIGDVDADGIDDLALITELETSVRIYHSATLVP